MWKFIESVIECGIYGFEFKVKIVKENYWFKTLQSAALVCPIVLSYLKTL